MFLDARRHGVVLVRPLLRALLLAAAGWAAFIGGWPFSIAGAPLLVVAAFVATAAVWRWDRTHIVLTGDRLVVAHGVVRKRVAAVRLAKIGTVEIEQSLLGRVLGYGTVLGVPYLGVIVAAGAKFDSSPSRETLVTPGNSWTLDTATLDPGNYAYFCRIHPWMVGEVTVLPQ